MIGSFVGSVSGLFFEMRVRKEERVFSAIGEYLKSPMRWREFSLLRFVTLQTWKEHAAFFWLFASFYATINTNKTNKFTF